MARKDTFVCDQCGAERKDANHWFLATDMESPDHSYVSFSKWSDASWNAGVKHLCGQVCAHKLLDEYLSK